MRLDDETLLTAYLDGELDAAGRHRVQAAVASSPGLARRLRDLAEARDLVEGLSRPASPVDLTASVLDRIASPVRPWAFRVGTGRVISPRWLAVASGLAAACLLLMLRFSAPIPSKVSGLAVVPKPPAPAAPRAIASNSPIPHAPVLVESPPRGPSRRGRSWPRSRPRNPSTRPTGSASRRESRRFWPDERSRRSPSTST